MKNENPIFPLSLSALRYWIQATRPITLSAGISPVLIGSSIASLFHPISIYLFLHCMGLSISLQIATNWANDYFDFVKGVDTSNRRGPPRAVQSGWIQPILMRNASFVALIVSLFFSIPLLARVGYCYLPIVLLCLACAILYSGGKRPLGYMGWGDLLVVLFYGPIATCGSIFVQLQSIPNAAWIASLIPGFLSCALLCVNNLRDMNEDRQTNKKTLVVRFGSRFAQFEYAICLLIPAIVPFFLLLISMPKAILALFFVVPLSIEPLMIVFKNPTSPHRALGLTCKLLTAYTLVFCLSIYAYIYL